MPMPSVTEIVASVGIGRRYDMVPAATLAHVRTRGRGLHKAIHYHFEGDLDPDSLHP